ncbi:uncharacterized protein LOC131230083 [Magnolia sinica]|uniref:uncharacterized protein LOC131230083 n=1 Tax=Magnolia sinica TaxID=86752 RepID=UPI00265B4494|nr:uncharacterized protein LOC131230083 [Magnolia sinica]
MSELESCLKANMEKFKIVLDASCTCLTSNEIHFKNIRFKSSTNREPGSAALYSSKQYNPNAVPLTELAMLLSPLQGNFQRRNLGSLQEKGLHHTYWTRDHGQ